MIIDGQQRLLVFSAHAADFCSRAGGTIARYVDAGSSVHVCDLTFGERCEATALWAADPNTTIDEIKSARQREIDAAARVLGASIECFDFDDCPLVIGPERKLKIVEAIRAARPHMVLTHWVDDVCHPDHVETTQAVLWACAYCGVPGLDVSGEPWETPEIVFYETTVFRAPAARFLPQIYVDIGGVWERKLEALRMLAAQPSLPEMYDVLGRYRGLEARDSAGLKECRYAEGFVPFSAQGIA